MPETGLQMLQKRIVGLLMLATLCTFIYLLYYLREQATPFSEHYNILAVVSRADAIRVGTPVTLAGIAVGDVVALEITDTNEIQIIMELNAKYRSKVRADSQATLINPTFGNAHIDISIGSSDQPAIDSEGEIVLVQAASLMDVVATLPKRLEQLDTVIANHIALSGGLVDPEGSLQRSLAQLNKGLGDFAKLTDNLLRTERQLFRTLEEMQRVADRSVSVVDGVVLTQERLNHILDKAAAAVSRIEVSTKSLPEHAQAFDAILGDVRAASAELRAVAPHLGELIAEGRDVLDEADRTLRASQKNFLIAPHLPESGRGVAIGSPRDPSLASPVKAGQQSQ